MKQYLSRGTVTVICLLFALACSSSFAKDWTCKFKANGSQTLRFGALNPASGTTVTVPMTTASLNADYAGDCDSVVTMSITDNNGSNFSGSRRLKNLSSADYIPYSLTSVSQRGPGNNQYVVFALQGTIVGSAYQDAPAGDYLDTVQVTVKP